MTTWQGLSDSITGVGEAPAKCRRCGAMTRLGNNLCLNCTLRDGLDRDREASRESFEAILSEDDVKDSHWRVANYEILEEIGRGGMGVIYRARQRHSRRIVALKRMVSYHADSRETLERFRREAEAAASLDHPNILPIYEIGQGEDGLPFFSMKYAAGGSLQKAGPALRNDPRESVRIMAKVAGAVQFAHEHGVLHRDLKPGNILLDGRGEPFVTDFGLAKWLDSNTDLTRTLTIFGTPGYIAPEQAKGPAAKLTPAADVYSLGAILFDLFTGHPPFLGEHALAVIQQASEKPAPKLRSLAPALDRDLETICGRCLEREPQARYRSAGDLAIDLERWLEGRPIIARRVSSPVRVWRWSKRNRPAAVATAAALCSAVAAALLFFSHRAESPFAPSEKGIAVLPFENLNSDPDNAFLADGVQDEVLNDLAKIADLKVISRTSVMQYKTGKKRNLRQIASELGVAHVVEGSVQRVQNRVRVNAQLIDAKTDMHLWADSYDGPLDDVFAIQSEIAQAIASQLQAKLSPQTKSAIEEVPTKNLAAYELYAQAKNVLAIRNARENLLKAASLLNQAVRDDPSFFQAYCQLAHTHDRIYFLGYDHTPARLALAEAAIEAAFHLRPDAGEAHLARAQNLYRGYVDYDGALAELEVAALTLPNNPGVFELKGYILRRRGKQEEAVRSLERAIDLDPRNTFTLQQIALTYHHLRRYAEEKSVLDRVLHIEPDNVDANLARALVDFHWKGDTRLLHQTLSSIRTANPAATQSIADSWLICALADRDPAGAKDAAVAAGANPPFTDEAVNFSRPFVQGIIARLTKNEDNARSAFIAARVEQEKIIQAQPNYGPPLCVLGLIDAALGQKEEALREGRHAVELLPVEKDAINGVAMIKYFAMIAAWVGENDLACEQLAIAIRPPSRLTYGQLKLLPFWDPLRGDPDFQKIVASLAPK